MLEVQIKTRGEKIVSMDGFIPSEIKKYFDRTAFSRLSLQHDETSFDETRWVLVSHVDSEGVDNFRKNYNNINNAIEAFYRYSGILAKIYEKQAALKKLQEQEQNLKDELAKLAYELENK